MSNSTNRLVVDVDGTLCPVKEPGQDYAELPVRAEMVAALQAYRERGFLIDLFTSRNMRTYHGDLGQINANTAPILIDWLRRNGVPFDGVHFGKPWPGPAGFYIDDRTVRPDEFLRLDPAAIQALVNGGGDG